MKSVLLRSIGCLSFVLIVSSARLKSRTSGTSAASKRAAKPQEVQLVDSAEEYDMLNWIAESMSEPEYAGFQEDVPLTNAEELVVAAYNKLRKGKPRQVAVKLKDLFAAEGREWAAVHVDSLAKRLAGTPKDDDNRNKVYAAHYFAEELAKVAQDANNFKPLSKERVVEIEQEFTRNADAKMLKSDFGNEVSHTRRMLFYDAAKVGLDVTKRNVQDAIASFAGTLASAGYETQLGAHQNDYGTFNSDKHKI